MDKSEFLHQCPLDRSELYGAAPAGNVETFQAVIAGGTSVNAQGDLRFPLHVAAARGDLAIAEILVAGGADNDALKGASSAGPCTRQQAKAM
jgi:hypothetical protein